MKKIIEYHNDLNSVPFRNFTDKELDLFFSIILRLKDEHAPSVVFSFDELIKYCDIKHTERFNDYIKSTYNKMADLCYKIDTPNRYARFNLFIYFDIDFDKKIVEITANARFSYILHNLVADYTKWDFIKFRDLRSVYAKTLFRLLNQFKYTGKYKVLVEEFKILFDVPESYETRQITDKIINPSIEELKDHFKGLKVNKIRDGLKIKTLEFTFRKFKDETQQTIAGKLISVPVQEEVMTQEEKTSTVKWYLKNGKTYWNNEKKIWGKYEEKSVFLSDQIAETFRKINNLECEIKSF